jgi:hypothetical protein
MSSATPTDAHEFRTPKGGGHAGKPSMAVSRSAAEPLAPSALPPNCRIGPSLLPDTKQGVLDLPLEQEGVPTHESEACDLEETTSAIGFEEALAGLVENVRAVITLHERHGDAAFEASHALLFAAYQLYKLSERDPNHYEQVLRGAGIKQRKNTPLVKRFLRLALSRAGFAKVRSTEHDWADWVRVMNEDGVAVTLDAVTAYRTECALVGGEQVKGIERLKARRKELRDNERAKKEDDKQQRAVEREHDTAALIQRGLGKQIVQVEWDGDSQDYTTGLDLLVLKDGQPAGLLKAGEDELRAIIDKHGLRG